MTTVFAYFEPILPGQTEEIVIWQKSWERYGWQTIVLGPETIKDYVGLAELEQKLAMLPTRNVARYEMACYLRWLALAMVGGGLLTDYDCLNIGFRPEEYEAAIAGKAMFGFTGRGPPAIYASADAAMRLVNTFAAYVPGTGKFDRWFGSLHISDMTIIAVQSFPFVNLCRQANQNTPGAKLVHCSHDAVGQMGGGRQRWEVMRDILNETTEGTPCNG